MVTEPKFKTYKGGSQGKNATTTRYEIRSESSRLRLESDGAEVKPLYDVKSTAQLLGVSTWTVRAYIRQGKLHPVRIGRLVRLDEDELSRFIASSKAGGSFSIQIQPGEGL